MAIVMLCQEHLGKPETDYSVENAVQIAMDCVRCLVLDSGAED